MYLNIYLCRITLCKAAYLELVPSHISMFHRSGTSHREENAHCEWVEEGLHWNIKAEGSLLHGVAVYF